MLVANDDVCENCFDKIAKELWIWLTIVIDNDENSYEEMKKLSVCKKKKK